MLTRLMNNKKKKKRKKKTSADTSADLVSMSAATLPCAFWKSGYSSFSALLDTKLSYIPL